MASTAARAGPWQHVGERAALIPPLGGHPASPPVPGTPLIFMSKAVIHHGPLITGPASHLDQKRLALEHPADCIFFPVVNCDLCVYVKKTRTLLSSAYRPGPQSGFAQTLTSVICSGWRVSCPRGGRRGLGDQSPQSHSQLVTRWVCALTLQGCPGGNSQRRRVGAHAGKVLLAPWSTGTPCSGSSPTEPSLSQGSSGNLQLPGPAWARGRGGPAGACSCLRVSSWHSVLMSVRCPGQLGAACREQKLVPGMGVGGPWVALPTPAHCPEGQATPPTPGQGHGCCPTLVSDLCTEAARGPDPCLSPGLRLLTSSPSVSPTPPDAGQQAQQCLPWATRESPRGGGSDQGPGLHVRASHDQFMACSVSSVR